MEKAKRRERKTKKRQPNNSKGKRLYKVHQRWQKRQKSVSAIHE
jgi:hypothetical protein